MRRALLRVACACVLLSCLAAGAGSAAPNPLAVSAIVSPEYPVSDRVVVGRDGFQNEPEVAFDGTNYLVVWDDGGFNFWGVSAARMSQSGELLDTRPIPISNAASEPAVAFDGTNYLVVWASSRPGWEIYGARVSRDGVVLDSVAINVSNVQADDPEVAFDGSNYLVVWGDSRGGVYGTRVSPSGVVLDPGGIAITNDSAQRPAVAFGGANYLVTWDRSPGSDYDVAGARVSPSGVVLDLNGIAIATGSEQERFSKVAFDGTNYFVVWHVSGFAQSYYTHVYGARVSQAGTVLDPAGIPISTIPDTFRSSPAIAFDGMNYLVTWGDERAGDGDIYGARVTPAGAVLDPAGVPISTAGDGQSQPSVVFGNGRYFVAWEDRRAGVADVYAARVTPAPNVLDPDGILASSGVNGQYQPAIAFDGTNYLAAWSDGRRGAWYVNDIYAGRVNGAGDILDQGGFAVSAPRNGQSRPAVAFGGANYLLAWTNCWPSGEDQFCVLYAARVTPDGDVLDPAGIPIHTTYPYYSTGPAIVFDGTNYLVVWANGGIWATRVSQGGHVLDPGGIRISTGGISPAVAFDGTRFLVAWQDYRSGYEFPDVYATRVRTDGTVVDSGGIAVAAADGAQKAPRIAFDGTNYLVAWQGGSFEPTAVCAARVTPQGAVLDPTGIQIASAGREATPAVAFSAPDYLVVWEDGRSSNSDVYAARVSPAGQVLDPSGIVISAASTAEDSRDVAAVPGGRFAVVYDRLASDPSYADVSRAFLRFVDQGAPRAPRPMSPQARCLSDPPQAPPPPPPPPPRKVCRVPRVIGLKLPTARQRIRARGCRVGRIRRVRHVGARRVGRVVGQNPRRGRVLRRGMRIKLTVGRR